MLKKNICVKKLLIIIMLLTSSLFAGEIRERAEEILFQKFSKNVKINTFKLQLNDDLKTNSEKFSRQRYYGKFVYFYEVIKDSQNIAYAILDNVKGKVKPITFLVIFENDLSINSVEIVKYREEHGAAIENKEWLSQFENKSLQSELELNSDIDGISSATISVKAIIKGAKRLLYLINNIGEHERNLLISIK